MCAEVEWLRAEVQKRLGPWTGEDRKGNPQVKEPLQTCIMLTPNQALQVLGYIDSLEESRHGK